MSYKFDSLLSILNKLDGGETVTIQSLIDNLEVSERTVHRYIKTLQVAGFPIGYNRSKETYSFDDGYCLRKPNLSMEETLAFALAKKVLKGFGEGIEKSIGKIEERLSIKKPDVSRHIVLRAEVPTPDVSRHFQTLSDAILNLRRVEMVYRPLYTDEEESRRVDPIYIFLDEGFWYLRGYCHLREDLRTFALDRIMTLKILNEHFLPKKVSADDELMGAFGSVVDGKSGEVVLRFNLEIKQHILRKKWHQSQENRELKDGRLEVRFTVNGIEGMKEWIYRWLPYVEVVSPTELREEVIDELQSALKKQKA